MRLRQQLPRACKNCAEHVRCQTPGIGVVTAAVIGIEQQEATVQRMFRGVAEFEIGLAAANRFNHGPMRDATERQHHSSRRQGLEFIREKLVAGIDLGTDRLVVRRQAFHGVRNTAIQQGQFVVGGQ